MPNLKKGDTVYHIMDYDHKARVIVRKFVLTSFGKQQATAVREDDGKVIKERLWASCDYPKMYLVESISDVGAFALELAKAQKAKYIQHYVDIAHANWDTASAAYHKAMKVDCEALLAATPAVVYR